MRLCQILFAAALVAAFGCEKKSPLGGHVTAANSTSMGTPEYTFRLEVPSKQIEVEQGKAEKFEVEMKKGKHFAQDVDVSFADLPAGVTVTPATFTLLANDKHDDREISLAAAKDAPKGDHTITIVGKPKTGESTKVTMKIHVKD